MNGHYASLAKTFDADGYLGVGSFATNGTSSPTASMLRKQMGLPFTVAYSATGIYTITFDKRFRLPKEPFLVIARLQSALADWADVIVTGQALKSGTPTITLQLHRSGTAQAPPTNANGAFVHFAFVGTNNTGA